MSAIRLTASTTSSDSTDRRKGCRTPSRYRPQRQPGLEGLLGDLFQQLDVFLRALVLVLPQKRLGNGIWKSQRAHRLGCDCPLRALFIHHDADNLDVIRRFSSRSTSSLLAICDIALERDKRYSVNVLEIDANQRGR